MDNPKSLGIAGKIADYFIDSKLTPLIIIASLLLGLLTLFALPREEEPQIIVPMIDIFVAMPGADAKEVEVRAAKPMEKLLWEIPGVEYVYTTSYPGYLMAVVRFYVGEDEEKSIIRLQSKLMANYDRIPYGVSPPLIKPRYIDDVPILCLTFWSDKEDHYTLRRIAAQVEDEIKKLDNVSLTTLIGGYKRQIKILLDPSKLAAYNLDPVILSRMITSSNIASNTGEIPSINGEILIHLNGFFKSKQDVENLVVGAYKNRPIYLKDVADIVDGPAEPDNYVFLGPGPAAKEKGISHIETKDGVFPAVTLSIAKRKGSNAIVVVKNVLEVVKSLKGKVIPEDVNVTVTRNYGETAKEKSNELLFHMFLAVISVTLLIWFALGFRESGIVAFAIPVTLALTIAAFYFHGYTLNRITLFALIFSIGILVDDAIVVVENIARHYRLPENRDRSFREIAVYAVSEVGNPTILASLTVIAAILPMAFVRGLMGPYMRPIPIGSTAAMIFSMLVAFIVTPWASLLLLKKDRTPGHKKEDITIRIYRKVMGELIHKKVYTWSFLTSIVILLILSCSLIYFGWVKVKMLPFDNKSEFQVVLDMPENATLEDTTRVAMEMADYLKTVPEVVDYEIYSGIAAPFNFNGMVRHYYLRRGANVADIQVNLVNKHKRDAQSHDIAKRVRPHLKEIADKYGARVKVVEVPPGPPVLSTLVAEIYGPDYKTQVQIAKKVRDIFDHTKGVVDVDWYVEEKSPKIDIIPDKTKSALNGIPTYKINKALELCLKGERLGLLHLPNELEDVCLFMRMKFSERSKLDRLTSVKIRGINGSLVPLSELVTTKKTTREISIYHKNLRPVVYVIGDVAGEKESPVYAILDMYNKINNIKLPDGYKIKQLFTKLPDDNSRRYSLKWDGEWQVTYEVFRDLGIAFGVVLVLIFILVVGWFKSFTTPLTIMAAIPFSLIGILPAHGMLHAFFTATSMIGFIAGAGIVVRNSIILVDFIELRLKEGYPLDKAVIDAGAVRFRPMLLTAAAVIVAASVILLDPIFQGLAISLMFGEIASLLISRMAVPILYYLDKRWEFQHTHTK
ncbi:efflux RND transporter permease subunit [Desulfothermus okinawensis JCM 13304]